jgi:hypothetical protein
VLGRLGAVDRGDSRFFESNFLVGCWGFIGQAFFFRSQRAGPVLASQGRLGTTLISLPLVAVFFFLAQCSSASAEHSVLLLISSQGSRPHTRYSFRCVDLQQHRFSSISLSQLQSSAMEPGSALPVARSVQGSHLVVLF